MKTQLLIFLVFASIFSNALNLKSKIWQIGENNEYKFCSQISSLVNDNDTIIIESGLYENDKQVTWTKNNLLIKGNNPKPILKAGEIIANDNSNGKGIFVVKGNNTTIENIEFTDAKVQSRNGAGIRQEGANLTVRDCNFMGNEMGILAGGTIPNCKILVEYCEFKNNGSIEKPGYQHNIYINFIDTLVFRFNYTQNAIAAGHEFKSRAYNNFIMYNRISNTNSADSRNIDLPNGGTALIVGNIIEQGQNSENSNIIGYGLEGLKNPAPNNLWIVNNTIINNKSTGSFIHTAEGTDTLLLHNNVMVGAKTSGLIIGNPNLLDSSNNFINNDVYSPLFRNFIESDYTPNPNSPLINNAVILQDATDKLRNIAGYELNPKYEYADPSKRIPNQNNDNKKIRKYDVINKLDIGAIEYEDVNSIKVSDKSKFIIYPNPAFDNIKVILENELLEERKIENETINLKVFDVLGNEVSTFYDYNSEQEIDISKLSVGVYSIIITNKFGNQFLNQSQQFVKVK